MVIDQSLHISTGLYNEQFVYENRAAHKARAENTYENIIVVHHNVLTTFRKLEQLEKMLGGIEEDIEEIDDSRRLAEACANGDECRRDNSPCNCDDEEFNCDCTPDYEFIKKRSGAGCDQFDSDGDGEIDNCEDRTPPRLILKEPSQFQCDETDLKKLCVDSKTLKEYAHAEEYLLTNVQSTDECATRSKRSIDVVKSIDTTTCEVDYGKTTIMQNVLSLQLPFSTITHPLCTSRIDTHAALHGMPPNQL